MEGYQVITSDDEVLGEVARLDGDYIIVEHRHLLKEHHYAIPKAFAHADDSEKVVQLTVSKPLVEDAPEVTDGEFDREAIEAHYGLVDTRSPELDPDDPEGTEEWEEQRLGREPAGERRAKMLRHEESSGPRGRQIIPSDSHEKL
jgi:hypothetical protein